MIGIPYFYRLFGYEYAIDIPRARALRESPSGAVVREPGSVLREATTADIPSLVALQEAAQAPYDVAMPHPAERWRWLLAHEGSTTRVLERDGVVVASARTGPPDDGLLVAEAAAVDTAASHDLLDALRALGEPLTIVHRPLTMPGRAWADLLDPAGSDATQYYARLERPELVLDALRPVLTARLHAAGLGRDVVISTFGRHYRLPWTADAGLGPVEVGGPLQAPGVAKGAGVAPDRLPALLLGQLGIQGLARLYPDVYAPDVEFFGALFPPLTADLLTYYLPW